jgi:hypothetical protein
MTTFLALHLGRQVQMTRKERSKLESEKIQLENQRAEEQIKRIHEQVKGDKRDVERTYEQALRHQTEGMARLLRRLEVLENRADWLDREGFPERAARLRREEVGAAVRAVEHRRQGVMEERLDMAEAFNAQIAALDEKAAERVSSIIK